MAVMPCVNGYQKRTTMDKHIPGHLVNLVQVRLMFAVGVLL